MSGLNLNSKKSTILRVGSFKDTKIEYCKNRKFMWTSDWAKTLSFLFSSDNKKNTNIKHDKGILYIEHLMIIGV
jgi:hypothetical protein